MKVAAALGVLGVALALAGCPAPDDPKAPQAGAADADPAAPAPAAPPAAGPEEAPVQGLEAVSDPQARAWLTRVAAVSPAAFAPRAEAEEQLTVYVTQSSGASGFNLLPEVDPHRGAKEGAEWSAHPAQGEDGIDLVRCRYRALGRAMELREGWNLQVLTIALEEPLDREGLEALLRQVVRVERMNGTRWDFDLPATVTPPLHLTNVGAPPVDQVTDRDQRVDVVLAEDALTLAFYKRVPQLAVWNQDAGWFRASTRDALSR